VIAVMMPPQRDYMHLDTVLSSIGKHAFTLHGRLATEMEVCTVETYDENNNIYPKPNWTSHGCRVANCTPFWGTVPHFDLLYPTKICTPGVHILYPIWTFPFTL
jgi:hypothetical protein